MKSGTCDIKYYNSKTFEYAFILFTIEKLELMIEKWKIQTMISFSIHKKIPMNGFMS